MIRKIKMRYYYTKMLFFHALIGINYKNKKWHTGFIRAFGCFIKTSNQT